MKLMYLPQSPFARKVRVAAIELGMGSTIDTIFQPVRPAMENRKYASDVNPLRKVPALLLDDGQVILDSTVICEYLDGLAGGGKIVPPYGPDRWDVLTAHSLAQGMTEAAVLLRYETSLRPQEHRWPAYADDQWDRIESGMDWFESNPKNLEGPVNICHIALACLLGYVDFRWPEVGWRNGRTRLTNWAAWIGRRDSFRKTEPADP